MGNSQTVDKTVDKSDPRLSPGQPASVQQPVTLTNENEQPSKTSPISADEKDSGPGTFEDLHKKCKGRQGNYLHLTTFFVLLMCKRK